MAFTEEQQQKYLEKGGNECPYCQGTDLRAGDREADADYISQKVECENCGKDWLEIFNLVGIEEAT